MKKILNTTYRLTSVILIILFYSSCKEDEEINSPKSKAELITAAPWKRSALISTPAYDWNADGIFDTNILNIMFPCERDNLDIYKTNGIFETDEGPTKCNASDPQTWNVPWRFIDNDTKIIFDNTDEYTLIELTETTLKLTSTFTENGVSYTHLETYVH